MDIHFTLLNSISSTGLSLLFLLSLRILPIGCCPSRGECLLELEFWKLLEYKCEATGLAYDGFLRDLCCLLFDGVEEWMDSFRLVVRDY